MEIAAVFVMLVGIVAAQGGTYDAVEAPPGRIAYQAGIFWMHERISTGELLYNFECSGALIHSDYVLTTASCLENLPDGEIAVSAGFIDRDDNNKTYMNVTEVIKHFMYVSGEAERDIAILKISPGFPSSDLISPILIQEESTEPGTACTVSGWREDHVSVSSTLLYNNFVFFESSECSEVTAGEICAGVPVEERGCEMGDDGSPLMCNGRLAGIMHNFYGSSGCLTSPEPGVFCDVAYHKDWIHSHVDLSAISTTSTTTTTTTVRSTTTTTNRPIGVYETVNANKGDMPHHVAVYQMMEHKADARVSHEFFCSGVVVNQEFVLTTVTCSEIASGWFVFDIAVAAGFVSQDSEDIEFHKVTQVIKHPEYNSAFENDIALLRISPSFVESSELSPITIRDDSVSTGTTCTTSGWKEDVVSFNADLKYGNVSTTECVDNVNDVTVKSPKQQILCGGIPEGTPQSCLLGDEGSPLVCGGLLTGLHFSSIIEDCIDSTSGIYHDISIYKQWIVEQMATPEPSTTDGTATSTMGSSSSVGPEVTTLSTTDHTTGELGGGSAGTFSSSIVSIILISFVTYLNMK